MAVNTKDQVIDLLKQHLPTIQSFGISRCGFFGSFVRDSATADSDVDVLIDFEAGKKSFDNFMDLAFFLEDLLGRKVDLITVDSLSPYIGPHILKEVEYVFGGE